MLLIAGLSTRRSTRFMETPASNGWIKHDLESQCHCSPVPCPRTSCEFNNKNCSRATKRHRREATWQKSGTRHQEHRECSADRECTVCLYKQNTGIPGNPIRQRRANYRESPFPDSCLFLGAILGATVFLLPTNSRTIQPFRRRQDKKLTNSG